MHSMYTAGRDPETSTLKGSQATKCGGLVSLAVVCLLARSTRLAAQVYTHTLFGRQTALNKYHADILHQVMRSAGYNDDDERDAPLFERTRDLLLKRTLQRPPLPADTALLKGVTQRFLEPRLVLSPAADSDSPAARPGSAPV